MRKLFDPGFKELVELSPSDWPVLAGQPRAPTKIIDADIATVSGAADKVLRVRADPPYLLRLEFHSGHDANRLPRKIHVRNALLEDRHDLLVRSVAVVLRPEADSPALTGVRLRQFPDEEPYVIFRYGVVRVWQLSPAALLAGGLGTLPLAPISAVTEEELPGIMQQVRERVPAQVDVEKFWATTGILMGLRWSVEIIQQVLDEATMFEESVIVQKYLKKGRAQGRAEGLVKGQVREAKKLLKRWATRRFGSPNETATAALKAIDDLTRLEELCDRVLVVNSWQELFDLPAPQRRRRRPPQP
jgi:predicted transposase YdaD